MAKSIYNMRLEDSTIEELEELAKARNVSVSLVLREAIERFLVERQIEAESLTLEQLNVARSRIDRMIADTEARLIAEIRANQTAPDLVEVEIPKGRGARILVPRSEAEAKGFKFQERKTLSP